MDRLMDQIAAIFVAVLLASSRTEREIGTGGRGTRNRKSSPPVCVLYLYDLSGMYHGKICVRVDPTRKNITQRDTRFWTS